MISTPCQIVRIISVYQVAYYPPSYQQYDVTAIFALYGMNRLFTLRELLLRFKGCKCVLWIKCRNVMLVIKEKVQAESRLLKYIQSHYLPSRLTIILYLVDKHHPQYNRFPVNYLRSLGISNVRTSHYIVLDIDLHPSSANTPFLLCSECVLWTHPSSTIHLWKQSICCHSAHFLLQSSSPILWFCSILCPFVWIWSDDE